MVIAGLTPREAVRAVEARLSAAGCPDADYDARELFRVAAGRDARLSDRVLTTEEAEKLEALCTRREQREPLQYLCGIWSFLDFDLAVGPGVLCPRADTEVVAEAAANTLTGIAAPRVLDLCAGTGCLGLGIKRFCPAAQVTCVEKSPEAFVYLEKNCRCALKGQGGQTEDLLEPTAFEQTDAPAFDWGPALNALRAKAKPAYAVQPVEGDLFTYWQREPLQYLCGIWSFLDFDLAVGPGVLCPRADTEVVAEAAANTLTGIAAPRVLDLCAGTGCLGLGIKRFCPAAQVTCVEKSPEAFVYLEKNCRCALKGQGGQTEDLLEPTAFEQADAPAFDWGPALNALRAKAKPAYAVQPVEGDLFTYWQGLPEGQLDLIVSNPPYLTAEEMRHLQPEVAQEPAMALEAGKDGLVFYRALAEHYQNALRPGGALVLEIGWQQRQAVAALLAANGWADIECRKDFGGNDRCMIAHRPEK